MSEETETKPGALPTGIYIKGNEARTADTPSRAAQLAFDGFVHKDSLPQVEAPEAEESDEDTEVKDVEPVTEPVVAKPTPPTPKDVQK